MTIRLKKPPVGARVQSRADALRSSLPDVAAKLYRRHADSIGEGIIADMVALDWLEWNGGSLRLTITGQNVCASVDRRIG